MVSELLKEVMLLDKGSLPGFFFEALGTQQIADIYQHIQKNSDLSHPGAHAWSNKEEKEVPLTCILDPALKVISGEIEPFNQLIYGYSYDGIKTSVASIYVFKDSIEIFNDPRELVSEADFINLLALVRHLVEVSGAEIPFLGDDSGVPREPAYQQALACHLIS